MKKRNALLLLLLSGTSLAKEISIGELRNFLTGNTYETQISELVAEEKRSLNKSPWSYAIPEVSFFGGVKSHDQEVKMREGHFLGLRSTYTLLDGGEKKLGYRLGHLEYQSAEKEKNVVLGKEELEVLRLLIKEMGLNEKLSFIKGQQRKLDEVSSRSREKVRAGVLSTLEAFSIDVKLKELENLKLEIQEELSLLDLEKQKKINQKLEKFSLKENLGEIIHFLKKNNLLLQHERLLAENNSLSLEKIKLQNENERNFFKPEVKLFLEKGLTRKIDGEFLEEGGSDRLVFGLEFEVPLLHESGKNFQEVYAAKTRQKILELEKDRLWQDLEANQKINAKQIEVKERSLERQVELSKLKLDKLNMKQRSVNSGLVEFPDYVESLLEWIEVRLTELEKQELLALAFLN